jgi:hypothetical protein
MNIINKIKSAIESRTYLIENDKDNNVWDIQRFSDTAKGYINGLADAQVLSDELAIKAVDFLEEETSILILSRHQTKEPWPKDPIGQYKTIADGEWGYLIEEHGNFSFLELERPTKEEIMGRWSAYLTNEK